MVKIDKNEIIDLLKGVTDPSQNKNIVDLKFIKNININDHKVYVTLEVPPHRGTALEPIRRNAENILKNKLKQENVFVILTSHENKQSTKSTEYQQAPKSKTFENNIKRFVAVASGKGGVGKSTTAVNLAVALKLEGMSVGLLDADIYGPSQPRMLGVTGRPSSVGGDMVSPLNNFGISLMSMGLLVPDDTAMIWRGPMVQSALTQMLDSVVWGNLDIVIIDLPPGTGDIQISLAQKVNLSGAIIISTPQDIALLDVIKSITMFQKAKVPILGMVENMSYWICPDCGRQDPIFGIDGVNKEAKKRNIKMLGKIPLSIDVRESCDAGIPITVSNPMSQQSIIYSQIAKSLIKSIKL